MELEEVLEEVLAVQAVECMLRQYDFSIIVD